MPFVKPNAKPPITNNYTASKIVFNVYCFCKKNIIIIFELNNWFLVEVRDWFNGLL